MNKNILVKVLSAAVKIIETAIDIINSSDDNKPA